MLIYSGIISNAEEAYSNFGTAEGHLQFYRYKDKIYLSRVSGNWIPKL